jgi:hypothetical protein
MLGGVAAVFMFGATVFHTGVVSAPDWLWLLPFIGSFLAGAVAITLWLAFLRELRQLQAQ